jgi:hypothetical protein
MQRMRLHQAAPVPQRAGRGRTDRLRLRIRGPAAPPTVYRSTMAQTRPAMGRHPFVRATTLATCAAFGALLAASALPASAPGAVAYAGSAAAYAGGAVAFVNGAAAGRAALRGDTAEGGRYRVICHFSCGTRIAHDALRIAEAVWPFATHVFGDVAADSGRLLEIHLYRTVDDYRRARSGFLRPAPRHVAATDPSSRTAHIALHAAIADTTLRRFGLPHNMLRIVAHEAFHLAALVHAPRSVLLPAWLNEGAASWAEHEALRAAGLATDAEHEPVASTYLWLLQQRALAGTLPAVGEVLRDELHGLDDQEIYAVRKLLFEQLLARDDGEPLAEVLRDVLGGAGRFTRAGRVAELLHARLFGPGLHVEPLQLDVHDALHAASPRWAQAGRSLDPLGDGALLQIGLSGDAEAWRIRFAGTTRLAGRLEPLTRGVARLMIGTNEEGSLAIDIDSDAGEIVIRRVRPHAGTRILARAALERRAGAMIDFDVVALPGRLSIGIGAAVLELELDDATPNGQWAVGVSAGANVVWHGLPN